MQSHVFALGKYSCILHWGNYANAALLLPIPKLLQGSEKTNHFKMAMRKSMKKAMKAAKKTMKKSMKKTMKKK